MAMTATAPAGGSYAEINMTPLIDVLLVLLIILIMTIPSQTHAIKIESPGKRLTAPTPPPIVDLAIDFDGALLWNKVPVDRATLQRYIRTEAAKNPRPQVRLRVDKFSKYEVVAQTLADLQRLGLENIGFVDDKPF